MGVHHEVEIRTHCPAHEADRFQVLLRARRGPHLVCAETEVGDGGRFGGVSLPGHVHAGAAIQTDAVAHAAAQQF